MKGKRSFLCAFPLLAFLCTIHAEGARPIDSRPEEKPETTVVCPEGSHSGLTEEERGKWESPTEVSPEESERVRPPELPGSTQISMMETSKKPEAVEKASGMSTILGDESSYSGPTEAERQKWIQAMRDDGIKDMERKQDPEPRNRRSEGEFR